MPIWSGGLQPLLPEMTYTATGFSNPVRVSSDSYFFHPVELDENERETVHEHFRSAIRRKREDVFLRRPLLQRSIDGGRPTCGVLARPNAPGPAPCICRLCSSLR